MENETTNPVDRSKEYLLQIQSNTKLIERMTAELTMMRHAAEHPALINYGNIKVQTSCRADQLLDAITKIESLESRISEEVDSLHKSVCTMIEQINTIPNPVQGSILYFHFVEGLQMEKIAEVMNYSDRTIFREYKKGLATFAQMFLTNAQDVNTDQTAGAELPQKKPHSSTG